MSSLVSGGEVTLISFLKTDAMEFLWMAREAHDRRGKRAGGSEEYHGVPQTKSLPFSHFFVDSKDFFAQKKMTTNRILKKMK